MKNLLTFIGGAVVGSAVTYLVLTKKHNERYQEGIARINELYSSKEESASEETTEETPVEEVVRDKNGEVVNDSPSYLGAEEMAKIKEKYNTVISKYTKPGDGDAYLLTTNQVLNSPYDIVSLKYYEEDDILCDEADEMVSREDVGADVLTMFNDHEEVMYDWEGFDPDTIYLRNVEKRLDYEITRIHASYAALSANDLGGDEY